MIAYLGWFLIGFCVAYCWSSYDKERAENNALRQKQHAEDLYLKVSILLRSCVGALDAQSQRTRDDFKENIWKFLKEN